MMKKRSSAEKLLGTGAAKKAADSAKSRNKRVKTGADAAMEEARNARRKAK